MTIMKKKKKNVSKVYSLEHSKEFISNSRRNILRNEHEIMKSFEYVLQNERLTYKRKYFDARFAINPRRSRRRRTEEILRKIHNGEKKRVPFLSFARLIRERQSWTSKGTSKRTSSLRWFATYNEAERCHNEVLTRLFSINGLRYLLF